MSLPKSKKYICECGSSILNRSISQHNKSVKHIKYIEAKPNQINIEVTQIIPKEKVVTANALRVRAFRERQKSQLGDDKYKESMRIQKQTTRTANRAKKDVKVVSNSGVVPHTRKETKEQLAQYVSDGAVKNCDQLINSLDKNSLVNSKYGEIKTKSLQDYLRNISLVYKYMTGKVFDCSNFDFARYTTEVYTAIQEMPSERTNQETTLSTKTKRLTAFKSILERLDGFQLEAKEYKRLQDESQKLVDKQRGSNKKTDREVTNWMDWNDIVKYKDRNWTDEDRLLYSLYTCLPPRRLEYGLLLLARHRSFPEALKMDKKYNYIVTNKHDAPIYIILNKYKTDYKYGTYVVNLKDKNKLPLFNYSDIYKNAKKLINAEKMKHLDPFFVNTKGDMYINSNNDSSFGRRVNEVFKNTGKIISVDILRHSFITNFLGKASFSTLSDNTLQMVATSLGHSSSMLLTYRKVDADRRIELFDKVEKKE